MRLPISQRISAAWRLVVRGSIAPFDRIPSLSGVGGPEKIREAYRESLWVYAAIRRIHQPIASVPLEFTTQATGSVRRRAADSDVAFDDPRLAAFWDSPAVGIESLGQFVEALVGWRKLAGEAFVILGDDAVVPFPEVSQSFSRVIVARPDRMRHVVRDGVLVGWEFTDAAGHRHALLPEQVIHSREWNPYDEWRGLGAVEVAMLPAETDRASAVFARNLAAAQGDQGVYVVAKSGVLDETQRTQIEALLRQKRELQARGVFRPVFLTGDVEVQNPLVRSLDAAALDARRMSAAEVFVALGVPPSMTKEAASYSIGSASDYFRLICDTCMPEGAAVAAVIARVSSIMLGRQVWAGWCWDEHPVLQEVRRERMASVEALWGRGVPMRTISDYLQLDLPRFAGDETGWLPISVVPAAEAASVGLDPGPEGEPASPAPVAPPDPSDPVAMAMDAIRRRSGPAATAPQQRAGSAEWRRHMRHRVEASRAYASAFSRVLFSARAEVLANIARESRRSAQDANPLPPHHPGGENARQGVAVTRRGHSDSGRTTRAGVMDLVFDLMAFTKALKVAFRRVGERTLDLALWQFAREIGREDPLVYPPAAAMRFLDGRENRLEGVADEVFASVKSSIQEGLNAGETTEELSARVRAQFGDMSRGRSRRIAMTETAAAYGTARQEGMTQAGVPYKRWLNSGGDNVRAAHIECNNQTVPVTDPFTVGGEHLMHPGDPSGSPANVINCHCVAVAVETPDEALDPTFTGDPTPAS